MYCYLAPRLSLSLIVLFSVCVNAQTRQRIASADQPDQQSPTSSTVRGRVVFTDGDPVKGVRVKVFTSESTNTGRTVVTANDQGEFVITGLAAGKYYISLEGKGVPQPSGMGMRIPLPLAAIPGAGDYPEIIPKHDAQFTVNGTNSIDIVVKTVRGGSITGKVMKSNGAPVAQAVVNLISRDGPGGPYMSRFSTQTDNEGKFRVENLPPTEYLVSAASITQQGTRDVLARLRGDAQVVTYHPAALRLNDALPVKVDSGRESSGVNVTLVTRKTLSISGSVVRGDGSPLAGAVVVLRNKESDITGPLAPGMMQRTVEADPNGQWSFRNVEEGEYQVVALNDVGGRQVGMMSPRSIQRVASGSTSGAASDRASGPPSGPPQMNRMEPRPRSDIGPRPRYLIAQREVNLASVNIEDLVLTIHGPGTIRGTVENENGEPLPEALTLFLEFSNDEKQPSRPVATRVGSDGSFVLTDVQAGESYVTVALPSGANQFIASAQINGSELSSSPLKIIEGAEVGPIQIRISTKFANVSGSVASGEGAVVMFIPGESSKQRFRTAHLPVRVSADGSFSTRLPPGEYLILTRKAEEMPRIVTAEVIQKLTETLPRVVLNSGQNTPIELTLPNKP